MNYPTHDTDWAISAKGNTWRRINGVALIVGKCKDGRWWARRGDDFLPSSFPSEESAKAAAEGVGSGTTNQGDDSDWGGA